MLPASAGWPLQTRHPECVESFGLAAQAGCSEVGKTRWVGKAASVVEAGQAGAGPSFRCPCKWRGCDSGSGQRPRWGRSCSPRGRWTRCLQMAAAAAPWGMGPQLGPRSLWVYWTEGTESGLEKSGAIPCHLFLASRHHPPAQGPSSQRSLSRACSKLSALPGRGGGWLVGRGLGGGALGLAVPRGPGQL